MTICSCGCVNEVDKEWGILKNVSKCTYHKKAIEHQSTGLSYYEQLGAIKNGVPQCYRYIQELESTLTEMGVSLGESLSGTVLEVGCGCSMYAPALLKRGYIYLGIEPNEWAATWTEHTYSVRVMEEKFEDTTFQPHTFELILAAHVVEHFVDAPLALQRMYKILKPKGRLCIIVPDDSDQTNPDHLWFFTEKTLCSALDSIGFQDINMVSKQVVAKEKFIYCMCQK